jgi:hypothetical protein
MRFLFVSAIACLFLGIAYNHAYTQRKKNGFDEKCNDYFVCAGAFLMVGFTLLLVTLGMVVFKLS